VFTSGDYVSTSSYGFPCMFFPIDKYITKEAASQYEIEMVVRSIG